MAEAATFPFVCPFCQQPMVAEVEDIGGIVECPACAREVVIPPQGKDPSAPPPKGWLPSDLKLQDLPPVPEEFSTPDSAEETAFDLNSTEMRSLRAEGIDDRSPDDTVLEEQPRSSSGSNIVSREVMEAAQAAEGERAVDDDEAAELLAALMADHKAVAKQPAPTPAPGAADGDIVASGSSSHGADDSDVERNAEILDDDDSLEGFEDVTDDDDLSAGEDGIAADDGPPPIEELDREQVRAAHKTVLKYASPFLGNPTGPPIAVYKAKPREAPLQFAVFLREPAIAVGFTAAHVLVSLPLEKKMTLVRPDGVRVQSRFKKAKAASLDSDETAPGLARVRILEQKPGEETVRRRIVTTLELAFDGDSPTERSVLRLRSLLNAWTREHPFLGNEPEGGGDAATRIMTKPPQA